MVLSTSIDGFSASTPLEVLQDDRDAMLAIGMNGEPLPLEHGYPACGDLDLAIVTHVERRGPSEIVRVEQLLWVTSARHAVHEESPLPLALGRPTCDWRHSATEALEGAGRPYRILYVSWHSTAVGAAVMAGLALSVLPESAIRPGMRILGPSDGFPALSSCKIGLVRNRRAENPLADALGFHIKQSLDNLSSARFAPAAEDELLSRGAAMAPERSALRTRTLPATARMTPRMASGVHR